MRVTVLDKAHDPQVNGCNAFQEVFDGRLGLEPWKEANSGSSRQSAFPLRVFFFLLLLSLPLLNPWVRGDGVGYYAFARALLVQRNLDFTADYQQANEGFREAHLDATGNPKPDFRTRTGHLDNHFSIGPAILWSPLLICAHVGVLLARAFGAQVPADGFSLPYVWAMAVGTLVYGFLALLLSYRVACRFVAERWALLATIAIWWASSLPVYMYFNPSWSHAHSAFVVALFFWYWLRTREARSTTQCLVLGLIAGLMMNVYYLNVVVLVLLIPEALQEYRRVVNEDRSAPEFRRVLGRHALFVIVALAALLPTFLAKLVIYGSIFQTGYVPVAQWAWRSPSFLALLFSANHGLFSWTPILLFAVAGIVVFCRKNWSAGLAILCMLLVFYYFMAAYPDWAGISSYGNRFFVSLTVVFVLGLATLLESVASVFARRAVAMAFFSVVLGVFIAWNLGLIFQWGTHLIPARGPVSWTQVADNQFHAVPRQIASQLRSYLFHRKDTLRRIEERDIEQLGHPAPQ